MSRSGAVGTGVLRSGGKRERRDEIVGVGSWDLRYRVGCDLLMGTCLSLRLAISFALDLFDKRMAPVQR
ncbi:hypothetical protein SQ03_27165 [Methylobacterium platani JCM 14648]|uniref:Uncharacterized protein n=1 Tax=Methylobacterium platani JCM 14648 TaxID=1295136 RepID=A0ABR5GQS9_9HYPH|nr:hypothetical protein SQ03_27165 [Methylobacterium platani JCM 14648]